MTVTSSRPLLWMTLGSLALLALSSIATTASAEQCPPPITVTKTEISTVWADGSWPTKTVIQTVAPNDCPSSPQHSCYVVHTTTMTAQIPQATIHMVLPPGQDSRQTEVKDKMNALELDAEGLDEVIQRMESMGLEAERFVVEGGEPDPDHPEAIVITDPVPTRPPTPTRPDPGLPLPTPEYAGPACVNYKTQTMTGPCPTATSLPLNKDGCAIIMSTALAMTTATAVPENNPFGKEDIELTYTYTYTMSDEFGGGETSKKKKHHHKTHPHKHHSTTTTTTTTTTAAAAVAAPSTPSAVAPPAAHDVVVSPPLEVTRTFETSYSTHVSYTLSFDFTYGTPSASPTPTPTPVLPELPPPPPPTSPTNAAEPPVSPPTPAPEPKIVPTSSEPVPPPPPSPTSPPEDDEPAPTLAPEDPPAPPAPEDPPAPPAPEDPPAPPAPDAPEDPGFGPGPVPDDLLGSGSEDDRNIETNETSDMSDPPLANESHPEDPAVVPVVEDPPFLGPPTSTDSKTKACQACAEPCLVELDIAAKAEAPLLQKLFETQIQKAIASLKITLQNEISSSSSTPTKTAPMGPSSAENGQSMGLFAKLKIDAQTSDLFLKTVEDRCARLEAEYRERLPSRCEQVVQQDCVTGDCLQREVDKAVQLLDVMLSAELAKDASQLRTEIVADFKRRCDDHNDRVEKRGLLGGLLGDKLGGALDKTVESLTGAVDEAVVKPLTGQSLVQPLVDGLTDSVKTVVDSFVRNCNRKGLLDFDTEKGVGTLAAITSVSLDLFKIVCVKANVDVKADV